ncbi:MAG: U32 family peptidase, partial [Minisyncoccales bacterium]
KSFDYFIPISDLNKARRELLLKLEKERIERYTVETGHCPVSTENTDYIDKKDFKRNFEANVSNHLARKFYEEHGIEIKEDAFELQKDIKNKRLMTTKYCLGFEFGFCAKNKRDFNLEKFKPPFYLQDQKGNKHLLKFDCKNCEMNLF